MRTQTWGGLAGSIQRCKKGDGVLTVSGGQARVVVEMHDSNDSRIWNGYLDEAERNREAAASIGIVRNAGQNMGQTIRVLGGWWWRSTPPPTMAICCAPSCS